MKLFSWGANSHGQLGQNSVNEACCIPTEISICLDTTSVSSIVGGGGHTLLLDNLGRAYSCGWNNKGQLGLADDVAWTFQPIEVLHSHRIAQLACGWDSSLAITLEGSLLVWGSNSHSQLGIPKQKFSSLRVPQNVPISRVKQASLGLRHLVVVTEGGKVFASGSGSKGQLGIVDSKGHPSPELSSLTQVIGLDNISSVSCGQHHTIALSDAGEVFVWGDNKFGQLGLDPALQPVVLVPQKLSLSDVPDMKGRPTSTFSGWTHSLLMTDKGELFSWGRSIYGQLGRNCKEPTFSWNPTVLKMNERIREFAAGSEHNLVLTETGQVLSWGWNEHGNCGIGSQENVLEPSPVQIDKKWKATLIGSGACHCFVILENKN